MEIEKRWEIRFLEIGLDRDHAHFLIQSVPTYRATRIVTTVKSIIAREVFAHAPEVQRQGGGSEYRQLHKGQLDLELSCSNAWGLAPRIFTL